MLTNVKLNDSKKKLRESLRMKNFSLAEQCKAEYEKSSGCWGNKSQVA